MNFNQTCIWLHVCLYVYVCLCVFVCGLLLRPCPRDRNKIIKALGHHVLALKILLGHYMNVSGHMKAGINQSIVIEILQLTHDIVWCARCKPYCYFILYMCF